MFLKMIKARWWEVNPVSMCKEKLTRKIEDEELTFARGL